MNELGLLETEIKNPRRSNITHLEKEALTSLTSNDMIIIKPADKGGAIVVMNRKDYIAEGLRQLGDEKFYQKLEEDPTMNNHSKVIDQLEAIRVRGEITQKVKTYLSVNKPRTAQLYLLPKIHKNVQTELNEFVKHLNTVHGTIKFTTESSLTEISFLDTMVQLNDGDISTDLYCKPTDRNNYLPYDSAHPPHCKKGLPYGQFLRLRRICSRYEDFLSNSAKKAAFLLQKKYPIEELTEAFLRAEAKERSQLLRPKETPEKEDKEKDPIYLTTTYNPLYNGLSKQVRKTWDLLDRASSTRDLHDRSVRIGYRRPKNLKDIPVKTKLTTDATCSDQPRTKHM